VVSDKGYVGISLESSVHPLGIRFWVLVFFTNLTTQLLNYLTFLLCVYLRFHLVVIRGF